MYVVDHKECRNGASFDIRVHRSSSVQTIAIFNIKMLFRKTDGSDIAVYRFQIDRREHGKRVFRTICTVSVVCNNDCSVIRNGVNGGFQKIFLTEHRGIEKDSSKNDEADAEQTERAARGGRGDRPEDRKAHPEYCEERENGIGLRGELAGSARPKNGFVVMQEGLYFPMEIV